MIFGRSAREGVCLRKLLNKKSTFYLFLCLTLWLAISWLTGSNCWFKAVFGIPCPGCGSTRAFVALWHGQWLESFRWHPLIILSLVFLPLVLVSRIFKPYLLKQPNVNLLLWGILGLYIGVYAVRMIFLFPHTSPMAPLYSCLWRQVILAISFL